MGIGTIAGRDGDIFCKKGPMGVGFPQRVGYGRRGITRLQAGEAQMRPIREDGGEQGPCCVAEPKGGAEF